MDKSNQLFAQSVIIIFNSFAFAYFSRYHEKKMHKSSVKSPFLIESLTIIMNGAVYSMLGHLVNYLIPPYSFFAFNTFLGSANLNMFITM